MVGMMIKSVIAVRVLMVMIRLIVTMIIKLILAMICARDHPCFRIENSTFYPAIDVLTILNILSSFLAISFKFCARILVSANFRYFGRIALQTMNTRALNTTQPHTQPAAQYLCFEKPDDPSSGLQCLGISKFFSGLFLR